VLVLTTLRPNMAPKLPKEDRNLPFFTVLLALLTSFVPLALLIGSVLGAILLAIAYRALTWERLKESVFLTARTTAMVCWLFVGAYIFTSVFGWLGGHHVIEDFFVNKLNLNTITFLIVTQLIIFVLGWPLEWSEIVLIFVPIFLPLLPVFGVDPILFGVLVALNLQTSFMTPPVAMAAYYLKGVAPPEVKLTQIFAGCLPFVGIVIVAMAMLYIFPQIATWLPSYLYDVPVGAGQDLTVPDGGFMDDDEPELPPLK
jgi:TRAP-type mannitol/chloroaromatic compound transport system permease large subunit